MTYQGLKNALLGWKKTPKSGGRIFRFHFIEQIPKNGCIWTGFPVHDIVGHFLNEDGSRFWRGFHMTDIDGLFLNEDVWLSYRI